MSTEQNPVKRFIDDVDTSIKNSEFADWYPIVKKEFADSIRTRSLLLLSLLYVGVMVFPPIVILYTSLGGSAQGASAILLTLTPQILSVLVPLTAIALAYAALSGERQSGSLKLLLSLPYTRRDVVMGKLFGRFIAIATPLAAVIVLQTLVILPELGSDLDLSNLAALTVVSLLLALSFVGLSLGASAATSTTRRSLIVAAGIWVYLYLIWDRAAGGIFTLLQEHASVEQATALKVELFVKLVSPIASYNTLLNSLSGSMSTREARIAMFRGLGGFLPTQKEQLAAQVLQDTVPWYLTDPVPVVVLLFWCAFPLYLGYRIFNEADL